MTEGPPRGRYIQALPLDAALIATLRPAWWSADRLPQAFDALARRVGGRAEAARASMDLDDDAGTWIGDAASALGLEAIELEAPAADAARLLSAAAPALVRLWLGAEPGFLIVLGARGRDLEVLGLDGRRRRLPLESVRAVLCWAAEAPLAAEIAPALAVTELSGASRRRAQAALLRDRLAGVSVAGVWRIQRPDQGVNLKALGRTAIPALLGGVLLTFAMAYAAELGSWSLIGRSALDGRLDFGWMTAWILLILTLAPLRLMGGWFEADVVLEIGRRLRTRLMAGALASDSDEVKRLGVGHLIGRMMEAQVLEGLALSGGFGVMVATLELGFAAWVLAHGAAPEGHLMLLAAAVLALALGFTFLRGRMRTWTAGRLAMSHRLLESMIGHRTRLAQERAGRRDAAEDRELVTYLDQSEALDRAAVLLAAGFPSAWLIAGLAGLAPAFASQGIQGASVAVSLGGVLLAQRALTGISASLSSLARAEMAWEQLRDVAGAASQPQPVRGGPAVRRSQGPILSARDLSYAYPGSDEAVFRGLDLTVDRYDRILMEGRSGGGKSTLAALLCGLRRPDRGSLLMEGLDSHTLGADWRRRATAAPQFHDNHILSGSLAFNLLMGRAWPPSPVDLEEAETVCRDLGLGDLLDRMPGGLHTQVGETGWRLSHGERSRIFLARALLQGADLTVLDESFGALDPDTLRLCLDTAERKTRALVVIAHP